MCASLRVSQQCVKAKVSLGEAAYIIAIHNQYFYFVSKEEV